MFKIFLVTLLVIVQVFGQDVDPIFASSDDKAKAELVERFGNEGTTSEAPMIFKYTPSDLKQFSGHALNFLKSKCSKVDANTIAQLRKFIGKFIAKKNPKLSDNASFRAVLDSISTCASQIDVTSPPTIQEDGHLGGVQEVKAKSPNTKDSSEEAEKSDKQEFVTFEVKPVAPKDEETIPRPNFIQWAQTIVSQVAQFIRSLFNGGHRRDRRSAQEIPAEAPEESGPANRGFFSLFLPALFRAKPEVVNTEPKSEAEKSFAQFFTKICRLYCQKCRNNKEFFPSEYMEAAAELRSFMFKTQGEIPADVKTVQSAIERHLTPEFMQTVMECK